MLGGIGVQHGRNVILGVHRGKEHAGHGQDGADRDERVGRREDDETRTGDGGKDWFTDDDGTTFEADIDRLATAGVTRGCNPPTNDMFCPDDFVTRGQMAAFLHRALG